MRRKIKTVLSSDIIKVSSSTGVATGIRLAASFIISKVLAVLVGPSGVAMLGQLTNLGTIFQSVSTGGVQVGVTKYIAEYSDDPNKQRLVINNALKITFFCSLISSFFIIIFYRYIGSVFFKTGAYNTIILLLGLTLILFGFNTIITSIINGFKQFRLYVLLNVISSIVSLIVTVTLVYYWGIYGAFMAFILAPAIVFFIAWFYVRNENWLNYRFLSVKLDRDILKKLGSFSLMAINNAFVAASGLIIIRTFITTKMDLDTAGIWDAMNRLSAAYMLLFTSSIQVYYLPTLSAIKDRKLLWKEILKTEKIILPIILVFFTSLFLFRGLLIEILFSKEFYLMKSIFIYQLIGDFIKVAAWIFAYVMYAKAMSKELIITDNIFTVTFVAMSYFLMHKMNYGLNAVYFGYILNNLVYLVVMYWLIRRYTHTRNNQVINKTS